jgi:rhodanese-related sulfurtransferase
MHCFVVYDNKTGKLLGMQAIGREGIDKRIDIASTAIKNGMDLEEFAELDLSYQPAYGSARDALNILGMIGENIKKGEVGFINIPEIRKNGLPKDAVLLDVRSGKEFSDGHIPGAVHIPIDDLRQKLGSLNKDKQVIIYCKSGYRAYLGLRILLNNGFKDVKLLNGSYLSWIRKI